MTLFRMKLLWLIKIRSVYKVEFGKVRVCSQISWLKPQAEVIASTWLPSVADWSFFQEEDNWMLNSPAANIKRGFRLILSDISCSKFGRKWSNSYLLWLDDWYGKIMCPFLLSVLISNKRHSFRFRGLMGWTAKCSLK